MIIHSLQDSISLLKNGMLVVMKDVSFGLEEVEKYIYINDKIGLHRLTNKHDEVAITLHLYSPQIKICRFCDLETAHAKVHTLTYQ
jgi:hypothetical protein